MVKNKSEFVVSNIRRRSARNPILEIKASDHKYFNQCKNSLLLNKPNELFFTCQIKSNENRRSKIM